MFIKQRLLERIPKRRYPRVQSRVHGTKPNITDSSKLSLSSAPPCEGSAVTFMIQNVILRSFWKATERNYHHNPTHGKRLGNYHHNPTHNPP